MTSPAPPSVNSCLCMASRRLTRVITQIYDHALSPSGLGASQFSLLGTIYTGRSEGLTLSAIADHLDMDISTVSRGITPLIRDGYVEQVKSDDRRQKKCRITDSGRAVWKSALPLWREAQAQVQERIANDSLDTLTELRTKIASLA